MNCPFCGEKTDVLQTFARRIGDSYIEIPVTYDEFSDKWRASQKTYGGVVEATCPTGAEEATTRKRRQRRIRRCAYLPQRKENERTN